MSEETLPKLLVNRIDIKSITYQYLNTVIEALKSGELKDLSIGPNTRVGIITSFGIIEGNQVKKIGNETSVANGDSLKVFVNTLLNSIFEMRNNELKKSEVENLDLRLINDSSAIILEDVIITPYSSPATKTNLTSLILFTEEIKGLTFGELSTQ